MQSFPRAALAAAFALLSVPAIAADLTPYQPIPAVPASPDTWLMTIKGNLRVAPSYPGADQTSVFGFPSVSVRRASAPVRFSAPDDGLSVPLYDTPNVRFGIVGRFQGGRYYGDDRRLFGLDKVDWAVEPGLFVEYWPAEWLRARAEIRHGFGGHHGFVGDLGVDVVQRYGQFTASLGPRISLGDSSFMRTYFGVQPFEAAINGFVTPYKPSGGITSVGAVAALTYDWTPQWSTTGFVTYNRLVGDAADSPIVKRLGSENAFGGGLTVSYTFDTGRIWP